MADDRNISRAAKRYRTNVNEHMTLNTRSRNGVETKVSSSTVKPQAAMMATTLEEHLKSKWTEAKVMQARF
jgi:hypothetical protein